MIELNKIYNEDCLLGMKNIPTGGVDMVVTSPPYNYNLRIHYGKYGGRSINDHNKYGKQFKDDLPMQEYYEWQCKCISEMLRISKGLVFYNIQMLTGNKVALFQLFGHFANQIKEVIIWDKINAEPAMHDGVLNSMYEFIIVFDKKNAIARQFDVFNAGRGTLSNVLRVQKNHQKQNINNNAVFPLSLPRYFITYFTNPDDLICDPFMGSGTTAIAAIKEKRNFIGFEMNKEYYDKACKRIALEQQQLTLDFD